MNFKGFLGFLRISKIFMTPKVLEYQVFMTSGLFKVRQISLWISSSSTQSLCALYGKDPFGSYSSSGVGIVSFSPSPMGAEEAVPCPEETTIGGGAFFACFSG